MFFIQSFIGINFSKMAGIFKESRNRLPFLSTSVHLCFLFRGFRAAQRLLRRDFFLSCLRLCLVPNTGKQKMQICSFFANITGKILIIKQYQLNQTNHVSICHCLVIFAFVLLNLHIFFYIRLRRVIFALVLLYLPLSY